MANEDTIKGNIKEGVGKVQEEWGEATGSPEHQMEGERKQVEGRWDQTRGNIQEAGEDVRDAARDMGENIRDTARDITS
jgi:uncharacterized protein YjbJ (UPF0337 family)